MKEPHFQELSGLRLRLRNVTEKDVQEVFFLRSDASVNQFVQRPTPQNHVDALTFIRKLRSEFLSGKSIYWVLCTKEDPTMIGSICLWNFSQDRSKAELGYDLHPDFQSQGFMSEAFDLVLNFGFNSLNLSLIDAYTQKNNPKSVRLLERHGFQQHPMREDKDNPLNIIFELTAATHKAALSKE